MKQDPETCSYFRAIYKEFKKLKGEREKAAVELFKKGGMEGKHKEIFKERIERDEKGMTFYYEETKNIKSLVQFTRLENNRHNHEVEFIEKHLEEVANMIRSKVTAHAEDYNLDESSIRQVDICDNNTFGTNYLQYLTSPRIEVSFRNDNRLLPMFFPDLLCWGLPFPNLYWGRFLAFTPLPFRAVHKSQNKSFLNLCARLTEGTMARIDRSKVLDRQH